MLAELETRIVERTYSPEDSPYETVIVDITHKCNMGCKNCYIPNRTIPDLDAKWLSSIFARLPRGTYVRLVGAEPTMREDLPELIRDVRAHGHHPVLVSNGLKLADRAYLRTLKDAGLQIAYLSFNGGFDDELYHAIDGMRCAALKAQAFDNLAKEHIFTSLGMIVIRGVNEHEVARVLPEIRKRRSIRELHLRAQGAMGRYMKNAPLTLDELLDIFSNAAAIDADSVDRRERTSYSHDFTHGRVRVQLTCWPDLGSTVRGRLTPEGMVAPFMEHVIANEGGY
ncbi:MAG TPA: radical SAM protein [Thermoanaerobaculia bacterium]|jgi:molybdenum cofactor biosynthesis enzyme MoaA